MCASRRLLLITTTAALLLSQTIAFTFARDAMVISITTTNRRRQAFLNMVAPKGFGSPNSKKQPSSIERTKSTEQMKRDNAASKYDQISAAGGQEYSIFVRQFGGNDRSWLPCGSVAVPRGGQVSNAIYANVTALKKAIVRTYPKLNGSEHEFEFGFNLKIYPDDPVEVAINQGGKKNGGPSLGNWISNVLSPMDASKVPPPPPPKE